MGQGKMRSERSRKCWDHLWHSCYPPLQQRQAHKDGQRTAEWPPATVTLCTVHALDNIQFTQKDLNPPWARWQSLCVSQFLLPSNENSILQNANIMYVISTSYFSSTSKFNPPVNLKTLLQKICRTQLWQSPFEKLFVTRLLLLSRNSFLCFLGILL